MMRILVADDHPMMRNAIQMLLSGTDYELAGTAASGKECLEQVERLRPDTCCSTCRCPAAAGWT